MGEKNKLRHKTVSMQPPSDNDNDNVEHILKVVLLIYRFLNFISFLFLARVM